MKKYLILWVVLTLLTMVAACQKNEESGSNKESVAKEEMKDTNEKDQTVTEESVETAPPTSDDTQETKLNLVDYRPKVGTKKIFTEQGVEIFTEEVIAANDEYVQLLLQLGDNVTTQVYHWTSDEITLVYEESNQENPRASMLDGFEPLEQLEVLMHRDENLMSTWKWASQAEKVKVPAGSYEQVLVIEKLTNEVVGEETKLTRYYAPKQGLVQEVFEQTGDNGFTAISALEKVE